jgi:protein-S-isoprenylcysteine O-methyltransferase Ste14
MSIWNKYFDWPPVWLLIFMAIAWVQVQVWNPLAYETDLTTWVGRGAIVFGIVLMGVSFVMFQKHRTTVVPKRTPNSIITSGPYKYSRNPIYVADAIVLIGYVLTLGSVISFVLVPAFAWVIRKRFINGEEVGIRAEFGQAYDAYCKQTRRWI